MFTGCVQFKSQALQVVVMLLPLLKDVTADRVLQQEMVFAVKCFVSAVQSHTACGDPDAAPEVCAGLGHAVLCSAGLGCAGLCCAALGCAGLCWAVLGGEGRAMLCCALLGCTGLGWSSLIAPRQIVHASLR